MSGKKAGKPEPIGQHGKFRLLPPYGKFTAYRIEWYDPESRQTVGVSTRSTDLQDAQEIFARHALEHSQARGNPNLRKDEPVAQALSRYYLQYANKLASWKFARYAMKEANEIWKETLVSQIDAAKQRRFVEYFRNKGVSDSTLIRAMDVVFAAIRHSADEGHLAKDLIPLRLSQKKWPPRTQPRRRASIGASKRELTLEEWALLYDHCVDWDAFDAGQLSDPGNGFRYLILATGTGGRPEAISDVTSHQINAQHDLLDLNPPGRQQNNKYRPLIPMAPTLAAWVKAWSTVTPQGHYLGYRGLPIEPTSEFFRRYIRLAKISHCTPYTLRHSIFSWLAHHGVDRWERKRFMGHKRPDQGSTDDYTHYDPKYLRNAANCIQQLFEAIAPLTRANILRRTYEDQPVPPNDANGWVDRFLVSEGPRLMSPIEAPVATPVKR